MVTHLFNAMAPVYHREPALAGALLAHREAAAGLIADLAHVHPDMLEVAFRCLGPERLCLVTDASSVAGLSAPPGARLTLAGRAIELCGGLPMTLDGRLAGSVLTMEAAVRNMARHTSAALGQALTMATLTPARVAVLAERKGSLAPGKDADLVLLDEEMSVRAVFLGGELVRGRLRVKAV